MLKVVYDNLAKNGFLADWGFSCFVNYGKKVLFDTGANHKILSYNLSLAGIDDFDYVFLSHEHYDHIGGIDAVLDKTSCVVVLKSFSKKLRDKISKKADIIEVKNAFEFENNFLTTGELGVFIKEQSMLIKTSKGFFVITGCSHPGLDKILKRAEEFGNVFGVLGGFHNFNKLGILKKYEIVIPCHCTAYKHEILQMGNSKECFAGCSYGLIESKI